MPTNCPFCANNLFPYHKEIGVDIEQSIFWHDDYIYMTPDISPIGEGHYLIITKEHIPNFASASSQVHISLRNAIEIVVEKIYRSKSYIVFEHGATLYKSAGNSIDHAHVHIVKGSYNLIDHVKKDGFTPEQIHMCDFDTYAKLQLNLPYIWINEGGERSMFITPDNLPSQYLRRKIFEINPLEYGFDWSESLTEQSSIQLFMQNLSQALDGINKS